MAALRSIVRQVFLWLPVAATLALSFYLSSRPPGGLSYPIPDWLAHGVQFFVLGLLMIRGLNGGMAQPPSLRTLGLSFALCLLWAVTDEYHQSFVPGRHPSVLDVLSDGVGNFLACVLFPWLRQLAPAWS